MKQGRLIAVEGADKAGKHTQVMNIVEYLKKKGIPVQTLDFPQYNAFFGKLVRDYLNGKFGAARDLPAEYTMLPYALDRQQHMPIIKGWLDAGNWVVLDRYSYSNVFSVAKTPREQWDAKIDYLENLEFAQMGILRPDYNIYLYLDPKIAFENRHNGLKEYQNGKPDMHESDFQLLYDVSDVYRHVASRNPKNWTIVDEMLPGGARMTKEQVFDAVRPIIDKLLQKTL